MAVIDTYLYPGEVVPNDVVLRLQSSGNFSVTDLLPLNATDVYFNLIRTDYVFIVIGLDDSARPDILAGNPVADTCVVQLTEVASVGFISLPAADTCAIQASEGSASIFASVFASDTCAVQASEGSASISSVVSSSDSTLVQASEVVLINSTVSMSDSAGITGNDLVAILVTGTVTDGLTVQLTEAPAILVTNSVVDSCAVIASESTPNVIQLSIVSAIDSCAVIASESTPLIGQVFLVADSCAVQASDVNVGPHAATASDAIAVSLVEDQTSSLPTAGSDSAPAVISDTASIFVAPSVTDVCAVQCAEVASQQASGAATPITASDSCALPIIDEIEPLLPVSVTDSCATPITENVASLAVPAEEVALHLLEEVFLEITMLETIWGGGMRSEEAGRYLYAGSYRMGPKNADETRGSEY